MSFIPILCSISHFLHVFLHLSRIVRGAGIRGGRTWPLLRPMAMPDFCLTSCGIVAVVGRCRRWRCGRRTRTFSSQSTTRQWKRTEQFQLALGVGGLRHHLRHFTILGSTLDFAPLNFGLWTGPTSTRASQQLMETTTLLNQTPHTSLHCFHSSLKRRYTTSIRRYTILDDLRSNRWPFDPKHVMLDRVQIRSYSGRHDLTAFAGLRTHVRLPPRVADLVHGLTSEFALGSVKFQ
jgi:hypothetical protein